MVRPLLRISLVTYLFLTFSLFAATPVARFKVSDLKNSGSPKFSDCLAELSHLFDPLEDKDVLAVNVGGMPDLSELLVHSGWAIGDVNEVDAFLKVLKEARKDALLRDVHSQFETKESQEQIFICLISKKCIIASGADGLFIQPTINYEVSDNFAGNLAKPVDSKGSVPKGIDASYNAIQLTMQADTHRRLRALGFVATLYHEARHVFDTGLMSEWIVANRTLINAGKKPSLLFTKYVRILNAGKTNETIVVLNCFEKAWLEPRGYQTTYQVQKTIVLHKSPQTDLQSRKAYLTDLEPELKSLAFHEVADLPDGLELLQSFNVKESNIFEIGPLIEKEMKATIKRAKK